MSPQFQCSRETEEEQREENFLFKRSAKPKAES
jgi:hypothetical protein